MVKGGVCVSGSAYDQVRGRIEADFTDLGEKELKNIARPVRVYALRIGSVGPLSGPPHLSIVVLPFANLGGDPEQDYHAFRLSPLDTWAHLWFGCIGCAKSQLGAHEEAARWFQKGIIANPTFPMCHFHLAAELALLGRLDDARAAVKEGLVLVPSFTITRFRIGTSSDNPVYLSGRERIYEGMRKAGVPQGEAACRLLIGSAMAAAFFKVA